MKLHAHSTWLAVASGIFLSVFGSVSASAQNLIGDGSFELDDGSWALTGTAFNPRCSMFTCGPAVATDGFAYLWLGGGLADNGNGGTATQTLVIPSNAGDLTFDWVVGSNAAAEGECESPDQDRMELLIDGNLVWRTPDPCVEQLPAATATVDISAYADDQPHTLVFQAFNIDAIPGSGVLTNFFLDNVFLGTSMETDTDGDGIGDSTDNCTIVANEGQEDTDGDGIGNACDPDVDNNCIVNFVDISQFPPTFNSGIGDANYDANFDLDSSGAINFVDYIVFTSSFNQPPGPSANECVPAM